MEQFTEDEIKLLILGVSNINIQGVSLNTAQEAAAQMVRLDALRSKLVAMLPENTPAPSPEGKET